MSALTSSVVTGFLSDFFATPCSSSAKLVGDTGAWRFTRFSVSEDSEISLLRDGGAWRFTRLPVSEDSEILVLRDGGAWRFTRLPVSEDSEVFLLRKRGFWLSVALGRCFLNVRSNCAWADETLFRAVRSSALSLC